MTRGTAGSLVSAHAPAGPAGTSCQGCGALAVLIHSALLYLPVSSLVLENSASVPQPNHIPISNVSKFSPPKSRARFNTPGSNYSSRALPTGWMTESVFTSAQLELITAMVNLLLCVWKAMLLSVSVLSFSWAEQGILSSVPASLISPTMPRTVLEAGTAHCPNACF